MTRNVRRAIAGLLATLAAVTAGCAFGPKAIERTHGQYGAAVQRVEEEQFLKNIVRLRYEESPRRLDVAAIAAQYEFSAGAEARPFFSTEATGNLFRDFSTVLPFGSISGANRPTISLDPQDDASTARQFLTPITGDTLVFLTQSGWPVSSILRIWADRLNGVPNRMPASGPPRNVPADFKRFHRAVDLLQAVQDQDLMSLKAEDRSTEVSDTLPSDAVDGSSAVQAAKDGFEYRRKGDGWVLVKRERQPVLEIIPAGRGTPEILELASLLNLKPKESRYEVVIALGVVDPAKSSSDPAAALLITPRSTAQALFYLANGVEVPPEHIACGLAHVPPGGIDPTEATQGVFHVHCCAGHPRKPPACAYVAVWYREHWYYIDDRDLDSKSTLLLMLQLRRLDFKKQQIGNVPALTLPVGR